MANDYAEEYEEQLFSKIHEKFILSIAKAYNEEPVLRLFIGEIDESGEKADGIYFDLAWYDVQILAGIFTELAKEMLHEVRAIDLSRKISKRTIDNNDHKQIYR